MAFSPWLLLSWLLHKW